MAGRAKAAREARRTAQFAKFRLVQLNLVPLVDTFVAIVFFSLTTTTAGQVAPIQNGVSLPDSRVGSVAAEKLTLAIASAPAEVRIGPQRVMTVREAARAQSDNPDQPLLIPQLYVALRVRADSIRQARNTPADQSLDVQLAIQGDKSVRYDLLSRVMQTARLAGFRNLTLQVLRATPAGSDRAQPTSS
ncbi:MAG: ExbD/TolR family protein [Gemmatimonadaceae bacterium]